MTTSHYRIETLFFGLSLLFYAWYYMYYEQLISKLNENGSIVFIVFALVPPLYFFFVSDINKIFSGKEYIILGLILLIITIPLLIYTSTQMDRITQKYHDGIYAADHDNARLVVISWERQLSEERLRNLNLSIGFVTAVAGIFTTVGLNVGPRKHPVSGKLKVLLSAMVLFLGSFVYGFFILLFLFFRGV